MSDESFGVIDAVEVAGCLHCRLLRAIERLSGERRVYATEIIDACAQAIDQFLAGAATLAPDGDAPSARGGRFH